MREGMHLKNQIWQVGTASSMWPMRSRAHAGEGHLDAAAVADDAAVFDALVLAAGAFPVLDRAEDAFADRPLFRA